MHGGDQVAWASVDSSIRSVIIAMNRCPLGAACVKSEEGELLGLITDGDLRRSLETNDDIRDVKAGDLMTIGPVTVSPGGDATGGLAADGRPAFADIGAPGCRGEPLPGAGPVTRSVSDGSHIEIFNELG